MRWWNTQILRWDVRTNALLNRTRLTATTAGELTDGDYGSATLWDGRWVGFSGYETVDITIDLGSRQVFQGVEAVF